MTLDALANFLRSFRRPYASMICSTALAACVLIGAFTGNWIPAALATVLAGVVVGDTFARSADKRNERDSA